MKVVPLEETELTLAELVEMAQREAVIVTRGGEPLVSVRDVSAGDWEAAALAGDARFQALIDRSRQAYRQRGGIPLDEVRRELGLHSTNDDGAGSG